MNKLVLRLPAVASRRVFSTCDYRNVFFGGYQYDCTLNKCPKCPTTACSDDESIITLPMADRPHFSDDFRSRTSSSSSSSSSDSDNGFSCGGD